jgi:RNA polymerase sigma-70 factor, ECF subfamily
LHNEKDILLACKKNTSEGQRMLYLKYAPLLKGVCARYVKDRDDANDVLQDAFEKIFKKIHSFEGVGSLEGWLKRILVNTALDHIQNRKQGFNIGSIDNDLVSSETQDLDEEANEENIIAQMVEVGFTKELLVKMLHQLPSRYGTVFNMFYIDGISHREIADLLETTEGNSRKLVFRAKEHVKDLLLEYLSDSKQNGIWKIKIK